MRKLKIYLDTSVISHLDAPDTPDKMNDTLKLWEEIRQEEYNVYISDITERELQACTEPKRSKLFDYLAQIKYDKSVIDEYVLELSNKIIELGVLTHKNFDDCQHIAAAVVSGGGC